MNNLEHVYALYKDDQYIAMGTFRELAALTGLKVESMRFYATKAYHNRRETKTRKRNTKPEYFLVDVGRTDKYE